MTMQPSQRAVQVVEQEDREQYLPQPVATLQQMKAHYQHLAHFCQEMMTADDIAEIPGTRGKSLLKPGAEKLCEFYGFAIQVADIRRQERWEDPQFLSYEVVVRLVSKRTGVGIAEGVGACNSQEKRYRNQDVPSLQNTILKMAKKRALVDATLSATRSSALFTQDLEDMVEHGSAPRPASGGSPRPSAPPASKPTPAAPKPTQQPAAPPAPSPQPAPASPKAQLWQALAAKAAKPTAEVVLEGQTMKVPESFDSLSMDELGHYRACLNVLWGAATVAEIEAGWTKVEQLDFDGDIGQPVINQLGLVAATRLKAITQPKQEATK